MAIEHTLRSFAADPGAFIHRLQPDQASVTGILASIYPPLGSTYIDAEGPSLVNHINHLQSRNLLKWTNNASILYYVAYRTAHYGILRMQALNASLMHSINVVNISSMLGMTLCAHVYRMEHVGITCLQYIWCHHMHFTYVHKKSLAVWNSNWRPFLCCMHLRL